MPTVTIPVTTADGVGNRLRLFRSDAPPATPVVLCMPAMGVKADYYQPLANAFRQAGLHAATADLRGVGASSVRASRQVNFGYEEMLEQEWPALIECLREQLPESPVYLLGHSLGGQINTLYLAENAREVKGMILVAASNIHYRGYGRPLPMLLASQCLNLITQLMGYLPGHRLGFGGREARQLIREWAHCARTGRYHLKKRGKLLEERLAEVRLPVMALSFEEDWMAPRKAVVRLYDKLASAEITHQHLSGKALGVEGLNHFNWARTPEALVARIQQWISQHSPL
ncbi:alpha/beta fold hydrolase [Aestuariirhabdus litorea]|uniref:Alpha/beta fold hydrolase n=1 Tax=Aestuariirhabdus litorea TaxID=2528527 RepID=A0A3P3VNZ5_9GAMM|nr:alpha/beta fold hydrolase [Aestuariirhabdus litorea]RRJ84330.1 alpha/beta fold hydrolase [Aestuariirhabdus litorea]RWW97553.1 alpha/beta fold hydrolase [Endozoicomonadaceae bacterium GTF-13]